MTFNNVASRGGAALAGAALCTAFAAAQAGPGSPAPLRTAPIEKFTVNPGFRDWAQTTIAGTTILGGNSSNKGGLFAVDTLTGKLKWSVRPTLTTNGPGVGTAPAVSGDVVVVPFGQTLMGLSLATGKELWRGPTTAAQASVAAGGGLVYVMGEDDVFYALEAMTGREKWKRPFARRNGSCYSTPLLRDGTVYVGGHIEIEPANAINPARRYRHLFALDAMTGQERWRYPSTPVGIASGNCLSQPIVTSDTYFAVSGAMLYAVDLATGRERWKPVEMRGTVEGRIRPIALFGLVDAGSVLVGVHAAALVAFDKASGQRAWEIPGQYRENFPSTAVAGRVLYFQGHPGAPPAGDGQGRIPDSGGRPVQAAPALPSGVLHALDLDTRAILWSFSRPTAEANWPFGFVTPVDGGVWVDSYQALVKLQ